MPEVTDYAEQARKVRRRVLPWDEFPQYCAPGGLADQLDAAITAALQRAHEAGEAAGYARGFTEGSAAGWRQALGLEWPK